MKSERSRISISGIYHLIEDIVEHSEREITLSITISSIHLVLGY